MSTEHPHRWRFFSAGGFDQVQLETPEDLASLRNLDQKLWASLACPTKSLEIDQRLLEYIDSNKDGRIRAPDILAAVGWTLERLADPELLFRNEPLTLAAFKDDATGQRLAVTANRLLAVLGRDDSDSLEAADTDDLSRLFPPNLANGDGLVPATLTEDDTLKAAIGDIITSMGAATDRSGEPAVSEKSINDFFRQAQDVYAWERRSIDASVQPFGELTDAAIAAITALREKVDDYFTRVELAAFDPRAASIMNGQESELVRLSALSLADAGEIASLPLAAIDTVDTLPLEKGLNPAWSSAVRALREHVVKPVLGDVDAISKEQWDALTAKCNDYFEWQAAKPNAAILQTLSVQHIIWLVEHGVHDRLLELVAEDRSVAEAAEGLLELDKLLRFKRDLLTLLRNFISFQDFYGRKDKAIFQAGTLYIDGKSCDLVVEVDDVETHAKVAANSNSFLLYCNCTRRGQPVKGKETMKIVAAVTAGTEGELTVGRNGLFYDRAGNDWDATVIKVVPSAISVREAFWSPYRRISNLISEQVQKLAANRDSELVTSASNSVESGSTEAAKAFDIAKFAGIFAAIGLAVAALGTVLAAILGGLMSLKWSQWPLVIIGVILLISGPSMVMAWFKLRRRNLGPILDANGWAVNTKARISIGFGTTLTQLAQLPAGSARSLRDPYAQQRPLWPWLLALLVVAGLAYYIWRFSL